MHQAFVASTVFSKEPEEEKGKNNCNQPKVHNTVTSELNPNPIKISNSTTPTQNSIPNPKNPSNITPSHSPTFLTVPSSFFSLWKSQLNYNYFDSFKLSSAQHTRAYPFLKSIQSLLSIKPGHVIQFLNFLSSPLPLPPASPFLFPIGSLPPPSLLSQSLPLSTKLRAIEAHAKSLIPSGLTFPSETEMLLFIGHLEHVYGAKLRMRLFGTAKEVYWYECERAKRGCGWSVKMEKGKMGIRVEKMELRHDHEIDWRPKEGCVREEVREVVERADRRAMEMVKRRERGRKVEVEDEDDSVLKKISGGMHRVDDEVLRLCRSALSCRLEGDRVEGRRTEGKVKSEDENGDVKREEKEVCEELEDVEDVEDVETDEVKNEGNFSLNIQQAKFENTFDYLNSCFETKILISQVNPTIKATLCIPKIKPKVHDGPIIINTSISKKLDSQLTYLILFFQVNEQNELKIPLIVITQTFCSDLLHQMFMTFSQLYTMPKTYICDTNPSLVSILQIMKSIYPSLKVIISQYYFFMHLRTSINSQPIEVQIQLCDLVQYIQNFIGSQNCTDKFDEWSKELLNKYKDVLVSHIELNFLFNLIISNVHMCIQQNYRETYLLQSFEHSLAIKEFDSVITEIKQLGDSIIGIDSIVNKQRNIGSIEQNLGQIITITDFAKLIINLELDYSDKFSKDETYFIRYLATYYNEFILKELFWRYQISKTCDIVENLEKVAIIVQTPSKSRELNCNNHLPKNFTIEKSNLKCSCNIYFSVGVICEHIFVYLLKSLNLSLQEICVNNYLANNIFKLSDDSSKLAQISDLLKDKYKGCLLDN